VVITLPAVVIPITLALLAAYAFAWIEFPGRNLLFIAVFVMQVVPIQVALIPLNTVYVKFGLNQSFWSIWFSHTIFGLPLAIFLLHNFMKEIPGSLVEAARVDGAGHVKIFMKVLLPLLVPAIASFGIFQFLWVWNDLLVALTFSGDNTRPITAGIQQLTTSFGQQGNILPAAAVLAMLVPLAVFLSLQRFFVRGLLAGSVKG
jgi:alpha-glucoside transport system permease protein